MNVIDQLKAERADLQTQWRAAQERIRQLTLAIDALEGRAPTAAAAPAVQHRVGPSVSEMLEQAARQFPEGAVFDQKGLAQRAIALFPTTDRDLRTGVYGALNKLCERGVIERCPGGFRIKQARKEAA